MFSSLPQSSQIPPALFITSVRHLTYSLVLLNCRILLVTPPFQFPFLLPLRFNDMSCFVFSEWVLPVMPVGFAAITRLLIFFVSSVVRFRACRSSEYRILSSICELFSDGILRSWPFINASCVFRTVRLTILCFDVSASYLLLLSLFFSQRLIIFQVFLGPWPSWL